MCPVRSCRSDKFARYFCSFLIIDENIYIVILCKKTWRNNEKLYFWNKKNEIEVPEVMIKNEIENMLYYMNQSLSAQGLSLKQYVEWTGKTLDELREETKPDAEKRIRTRILLKNVIRMEGLEVEDEEIRELMEDFGKQYGMDVDQVKEMAGSETENYFREDAQTKKAIDWLFDNAEQVAAKAEEAE